MIKKFVKLFFINKCALCGRESDGVLCKDCLRPLKILNFGLCQRCGKPIKSCVCKNLDKAVVRCVSAYRFEEPAASSLIYKLKSKGNRKVVNFFSEAMAEKFKTEYSAIEFDSITYVPVSMAKLKQKGFDHARLLAEKLSEILDIPLLEPPIKRRPKPSQKLLSKLMRLSNAESAFKPVAKRKIDGTILLIDDVATTGATLSVCVSLIRSAGGKKVYCLTAATSAPKT